MGLRSNSGLHQSMLGWLYPLAGDCRAGLTRSQTRRGAPCRQGAANPWGAGRPGRANRRTIPLAMPRLPNPIRPLAAVALFCVAWVNAAFGRPVEALEGPKK